MNHFFESTDILDSITPKGWDGTNTILPNGAECECRPCNQTFIYQNNYLIIHLDVGCRDIVIQIYFSACSKTGYSTSMSSAGFPNKASKFFDQSSDLDHNQGSSNPDVLTIRNQNR